MATQTEDRSGTWPKTVFDTDEWTDAWSRSTIERVIASDEAAPPMYAVQHSPFWKGYEADAGVEPVWDRPVLTVGSMYCFYGPAHLAHDAAAVRDVLDRARRRTAEWDSPGVLVANLPTQAAREWSAVCAPDAVVRLDVAYYRNVGEGTDPIVGSVSKSVRGDWRRRWRRATEQGVRLVEEDDPAVEDVDDVLALANTSAVKHDWPPVYDRATAVEVLRIPGARLIRAVWSGRTVAGFVALEHDRRLYLWAGGTDQKLLREVSPYLFLLYELLAAGGDRGWDRIEFGRGNDEFKRRYGFAGNELVSLWYAARPEDVSAYRPKLETLHDRLGTVMGL